MSHELNLFGEAVYTGTDREQIQNILDRYPAAKDNTGLYYWLMMLDTCGWLAQLDEKRQMEMRQFCYRIESLRRRKQELTSES